MRFLCCLGLLLGLLVSAPAVARAEEFAEMFPGVSLLTGFAHDHGDTLEAVLFEGDQYPDLDEATSVILPLFGWRDLSQRIALGKVWVERVVFFGSRVPEGSPAVPELLPDGTFRYQVWVVSMQGRTPGSYSFLWRVDITPEASLKMQCLQASTSRPGELPGSP